MSPCLKYVKKNLVNGVRKPCDLSFKIIRGDGIIFFFLQNSWSMTGFHVLQRKAKFCTKPKVCNLWHKSGVRYMRTCQKCPPNYPWTGNTGISNSQADLFWRCANFTKIWSMNVFWYEKIPFENFVNSSSIIYLKKVQFFIPERYLCTHHLLPILCLI